MKKLITKNSLVLLLVLLLAGCITVKHTYPTRQKIKPVQAVPGTIPSIAAKTIFRNDDKNKVASVKFVEKTFQPPMSYIDFMTDDDATAEKYTKGTATTSQGEKTVDNSKSTGNEIVATDKNWKKTYQIQAKKTPFIYSYSLDTKKRKADLVDNDECITKYYNFNCQSTSFMNADFESQNQYLYPSAIYSVNDFENGNFKDITERRNPITLSTDNPNLKGNSFITITNPNLVTIREGVQKLYGNFDADKSGNMDFRYQIFESSNNVEQQLKLATGGGGNYGLYGGSMETTLNNETKQTHHYLTVDIIKDMFSINSMCKNYFDTSSMYTSDKIVISSVTYGLRIIGNIDVTGYESKIDSEIKSSGNAGITDVFSAHGHLDLTFISKVIGESTKVNCYIVGGPNTSSCAFTVKDFQTAITTIVSGVTVSNARPIQYTLSDLNGDVISIKSSVTDIKQRICPVKSQFSIKNFDYSFLTGNDDKDDDNHVSITFTLLPANKIIYSNSDVRPRLPEDGDATWHNNSVVPIVGEIVAPIYESDPKAKEIQVTVNKSDDAHWHMGFDFKIIMQDGSKIQVGSEGANANNFGKGGGGIGNTRTWKFKIPWPAH